ncbi:hypothetical protein POM88_034723 [Heracleum sosnowskyi]|uniref:Uncharacterized protein n=1 Tax=Heracleum sosnowskyi TaxID=360622 RepID=A0AAD8HK10_9APIA|nr:hypothetical protein POM88_034723 [Heracleum sosnowskyi]
MRCVCLQRSGMRKRRVKTLTAEMDQFQEAHSDIEVGIVKLDAEKKEASVAFEAFNTAKEEFERISTHLLQLVKQKGDGDDILQVHTQTKKLFASISPTQVALPSPYQSGTVANSSVSQSAGKRKRTISPCITEDGNDENGTAPEVHLPQKKKDESKVSSMSVTDHEMPPAETRDGVPELELPSSPEEEKPICGLLVPAQEPDDRQHLLNAASVLKSNLVDRLTSFANILSAEDMILLAISTIRSRIGSSSSRDKGSSTAGTPSLVHSGRISCSTTGRILLFLRAENSRYIEENILVIASSPSEQLDTGYHQKLVAPDFYWPAIHNNDYKKVKGRWKRKFAF